MKTTKVIYDSRQQAVMTDTGSEAIFVRMNEKQVVVAEPNPADPDGEPVEVTKYEYDEARLVPATKSTADVLDCVKQAVIADIEAHDKSEAVNRFTYQGAPMWLDDAMRTKLLKRFETDEQDGLTTTKLIYDGTQYTLPIDTARQMLHAIESYARDCFDKTEEHKATVAALTTVKKVLAYDYTQGYPKQLTF